MPRNTNDLLHGTLDLLVLRSLAGEPMHGFGIVKWIEARTEREFVILDSALYKALHRLEDAGAITSEWGISEHNRRANYYSLTARGRKALRAETVVWKRYVTAVTRALDPA
ncbi:MAG TPA: PadR family transcriptional regulator [Gemmatimonadaceae bacterium]|jgi:transcriptional regulator